MKTFYRIAILSLIVILAVASIAAAPAQRGRSPLAGKWRASDAGDGQPINVSITRFNQVNFQDKSNPACGGGAAKGKGFGTVHGNSLSVTLHLRCVGSGVIVSNSYAITFHRSGAFGMTDSLGNTYRLLATVCQ